MAMSLEITFRGMEPSEAVAARARSWAERLDRVYARILRGEVVVEAPHQHHNQGRRYHVRVTLYVPGGTIVASRDPGRDPAHEDVYVALRDTFRAARRQLEDHVRVHLQAKVKAHEEPARGRVRWLDVEREWGYIEAGDGRSVYFHRNSVLGDAERLGVGDEVRFVEEAGEKGPQASTVTRIGPAPARPLPAEG